MRKEQTARSTSHYPSLICHFIELRASAYRNPNIRSDSVFKCRLSPLGLRPSADRPSAGSLQALAHRQRRHSVRQVVCGLLRDDDDPPPHPPQRSPRGLGFSYAGETDRTSCSLYISGGISRTNCDGSTGHAPPSAVFFERGTLRYRRSLARVTAT